MPHPGENGPIHVGTKCSILLRALPLSHYKLYTSENCSAPKEENRMVGHCGCVTLHDATQGFTSLKAMSPNVPTRCPSLLNPPPRRIQFSSPSREAMLRNS